MELLDAYVPMDRRQALARDETLPDRAQGAALFADISGFTPLTEALVHELGPQRGAEELTRHLNLVYDAVITELHRYSGSVISFSGDAITCWFDKDVGLRATACALAMQKTMDRFSAVPIPSGITVSLAMKTSVATGAARRFLVGDPQIYVIDVLAGATLDRLARAEQRTRKGEVVLDPPTVRSLSDKVQLVAWRQDDLTGERCGVVDELVSWVAALPWPAVPLDAPGEEQIRPWLLPPVYERLRAGQGEFLAELRPAVALFMRFSGIEYDEDETAGDKLDVYVRWVQSVLVRYDGYLLQLSMGDKGSYLLAAFGAPIAHEDDAIRAVSAALELQAPPDGLDFIKSVQIGISQGLMRTGAYGGTMRRVYSVLGDDVNLAARLMEAAAPGQTLVGHRVRQAAGDTFVWQRLPTLKVKGKTEPVAVFSPNRTKKRRAVHLHAPVYALPMVGRAAELERIEQKLAQVTKGEGQLVGITGEAGVGKTRLVAEIIRKASEQGLTAFASECESYGTNTSYLVWRPIWRDFFGLDTASDLVDQLRVLEAQLERVDPALVPRTPLLGAALNLPIPDNDLTQSFDAKLRKESLEALLVDCLRARTRTMPLLFVLEDCHWLDPLSHDLVEVIGRAIADLPVLLVLAYRPPEAQRPQVPHINQLAHFTAIRLTDLTRQEAEELISLKLTQFSGAQTEAPAALVERIVARAEGNPFYIEELLNYIHDQAIDPHDYAALERLDLPTSLHSLILSRLDQLSESQRITLKVASIIGRLFRAALLWGVYPEVGEPERVKADLEALSRLDLMMLETPEPELTYLFKHIVTQEVAYESLPYATRAVLHEQLARFIERSYSGPLAQHVDILAYHYERSENEIKKCEYLRKAGQVAQADYANEAALDYYQRVLRLLPLSERAPVLLRLGDVLTLVGRYDKALESYLSAQALVVAETPSADRLHRLADLCRRTAEVYERRSEYDVALEWLEKGLGYLDEDEPSLEAVRIYILRAGVYLRQGKIEDAIAWCHKSLTVASGIESREGRQAVGHAYHLLGGSYIRHGDLDRAVHYARESIAVYQQIENIAGQAKAYNNLGVAHKTQGEWGLASEAYHKSLAINRQIGDVLQQGFASNNLGNIYIYRGKWAEAVTLFEESNVIWKQLGATWPEAVTLSNLAQVHIYRKSWSEAFECMNRSQAILKKLGATGFVAELERRWGEYHLGTGALDEALAHTHRSIELAQAGEDRLEEGISARVLGEVQLARGEWGDAENALRQSLQILSDLDSAYEAAKTTLSLARLALAKGSAVDWPQLEQAVQTFEQLGAQADLDAANKLSREAKKYN